MFAVFAETHDGREIRLAQGFATLDAAEEHPVRLKDYRRVWADLDGVVAAIHFDAQGARVPA